MEIAGYAFRPVVGRSSPVGIYEVVAIEVVLVRGERIAETTVETVDVVLVLEDVEVAAYAGIGTVCLVAQVGRLLRRIGFAESYLHDGEILVLQVEAHGSLVLAIAADGFLDDARCVNAYGYSPEQGNGVLGCLHGLLGLLCLHGGAEKEQETTQYAPQNRCGNVVSLHRSLLLYC